MKNNKIYNVYIGYDEKDNRNNKCIITDTLLLLGTIKYYDTLTLWIY